MDLNQIRDEVATIEELHGWRSRLLTTEASGEIVPGVPATPEYLAKLRQNIALLEAMVAAFPKETPHA
jgi:hypothetical protein